MVTTINLIRITYDYSLPEYYNKTAILKNFYSAQNKYFGVNGVGSIKEITSRLSSVIDKL